MMDTMSKHPLSGFMAPEGRTEVTEHGDVQLFASVLFQPRGLDDELSEAIGGFFGAFEYLVGAHVGPGFLDNLGREEVCKRDARVLTNGADGHVMVFRIQVGNAQSVVCVPMANRGLVEYLAGCERTGFMPVVGWCPECDVKLLLHVPVEKADIKQLKELARQAGQNPYDIECLRLADLATRLAHHERMSMIEGFDLEERVISCVVPRMQH